MLLERRVRDGIADGSISLVVRRWRRPTVKTGGTVRTAAGLLAIDAVELVADSDLTEEDARRAGFGSLGELLADVRPPGEGELYRIELRRLGPDPRLELRSRDDLSDEELADVRSRLARLDRASRDGPWTTVTLRSIAAAPGVRAADLAAAAGLERDRFKLRVRRLKELGLTESLEVGYRLSPRGQAVLALLP